MRERKKQIVKMENGGVEPQHSAASGAKGCLQNMVFFGPTISPRDWLGSWLGPQPNQTEVQVPGNGGCLGPGPAAARRGSTPKKWLGMSWAATGHDPTRLQPMITKKMYLWS